MKFHSTFSGEVSLISHCPIICYNHFLSEILSDFMTFMMHHRAAGVVVVDKNISNVTKIFYCLCGGGGGRGDTTAKWGRMKIK